MTLTDSSSILIRVSGADKPGITSSLTEILTQDGIEILDIAQAVIHHLLSLSILFQASSPEAAQAALKDLLLRASELGLKLEFDVLDRAAARANHVSPKIHHYAVTLLADRVTPRSLCAVTQALAHFKLNIDVIKRLSEGRFSCVEMLVSSGQPLDDSGLKKELLAIAKAEHVDIALQAEGLYRRAKRLVVLDMDSTLIQSEVIDELARAQGCYEQVAAITHEAMSGRIDYDESLRRRVAKLQGLSADKLEEVYRSIQLTPGASDLIRVLKKLGYKIAVISGGFTFVADRLKERLGIDFAYANVLEVKDGVVTGRVHPPIVNAQRKADLLEGLAQQERIELDQVIAIGDGANDLLMLERAGLGIAFNAKPAVSERADLALSQRNLRSILYLLGLSERDVAGI